MKPGRPLGRRNFRRRPRRAPTGRPSVDLAGWRVLRAKVFARAGNACEYCGNRRGPLDPHHVVARSQGGADSYDNVIVLCRVHHDMVNAPYNKQRLMITPSGMGQFLCKIVRGTKDEYEVLHWKVAGGPENREAEILRVLKMLYRDER